MYPASLANCLPVRHRACAVLGVVALVMAGGRGRVETNGCPRRGVRAGHGVHTSPGDIALEHHTSGFAKILYSAVFVSGLDADFAAENVGYFTSPYPARAEVTDRVVDTVRKEVRLTLSNGVTRVAKYLGDQGCVSLPIGEDDPYFTPTVVKSALPDPSTRLWPMGDVLPNDPLPPDLDGPTIERAVRAAFEPDAARTAAFVVTWKGRVIGERYGDGITMHTPLESWSMGKSLTATLMGVLVHRGVYELWQPAPVPEWQTAGDARAEIRIGDILRMSSGLRCRAPQDPDFDPSLGYPDHLYLYTAAPTRSSGPRPGRSSGHRTPWDAIGTATRSSPTI